MRFAKEFVSDILVIGSGAAGSIAAIKAQQAGADVLVVTKGPYPSGNSTKAIAGYAAAFGHSDPRDNPDIHFADVVRNGIGLCNQKLVHTWVNRICALTEEMTSWGMDLIQDGNKYAQTPWEGHTYPRMVNHNRTTGKYVMKCLAEKSLDIGINAISHTIIGGLLKSGDAVCGAWGVDYKTGEALLFKAKAVITTTGGMGAMFPLTDNVALTTGEGYAHAFNAGAEMIGMEFGHFLPTVIYPERMKVHLPFIGYINGLINEGGARLYNGDGERFMFKYYPETGEQKRNAEELTRAIGQEIVEGRVGPHGGIFLDLSDIPEDLKTSERYAYVWQLAKKADFNLNQQSIELVPNPHDLVGGIMIDDKSQTNVPGLFASGEAAGGSHGASRFGGSALADAMVFGEIGAETAIDYIQKLPQPREANASDLSAILVKLGAWQSQDGVDPIAAKKDVQWIAFNTVNIVKSLERLKQGFSEIDQMETEIVPKLSAKSNNPKDRGNLLKLAIEIEGMLQTCRIMATAALERTESRGGFFGGHYRIDHPEQNDENWLKNLILKKDLTSADHSIFCRTQDPVILDKKWPTEIQNILINMPTPNEDYHISE